MNVGVDALKRRVTYSASLVLDDAGGWGDYWSEDEGVRKVGRTRTGVGRAGRRIRLRKHRSRRVNVGI